MNVNVLKLAQICYLLFQRGFNVFCGRYCSKIQKIKCYRWGEKKNDWMNEHEPEQMSRSGPKWLVSSTAVLCCELLSCGLVWWWCWCWWCGQDGSIICYITALWQKHSEGRRRLRIERSTASVSLSASILTSFMKTFSHICTILRPLAQQHICNLLSTNRNITRYTVYHVVTYIINVYCAAFLCFLSLQTQYLWVLDCTEDIWQIAIRHFSPFLTFYRLKNESVKWYNTLIIMSKSKIKSKSSLVTVPPNSIKTLKEANET